MLLERYGMTELGHGALEHARAAGAGPGRRAASRASRSGVVDDGGHDVPDGEPGELLVRGPQVFSSTGDAARDRRPRRSPTDGSAPATSRVHEPDGYRLLGRSSVDIIKTGGEKVSALEIEEVYRTHPAVADCAVVGVPDPEWGERVCAAMVVDVRPRRADALRAWGKERLAAAKVPSRFAFVAELPRNPMGKVTKADVGKLFA